MLRVPIQSMPERQVTITNKLGLHARASASFVQQATNFDADIFVKKDAIQVNGKSIMGVMMLAAAKGTVITLIAKGKDADSALDSLAALIANKFGEAE